MGLGRITTDLNVFEKLHWQKRAVLSDPTRSTHKAQQAHCSTEKSMKVSPVFLEGSNLPLAACSHIYYEEVSPIMEKLYKEAKTTKAQPSLRMPDWNSGE